MQFLSPIAVLHILLIIISNFYRELKTEDIVENSMAVDTGLTSMSSSPEDVVVVVNADKSGEREGEGYSGSEDSDSNQNEKSAGVKIPKERRPYYESTEKYRKTLRLSSEQIVRSDKW